MQVLMKGEQQNNLHGHDWHADRSICMSKRSFHVSLTNSREPNQDKEDVLNAKRHVEGENTRELHVCVTFVNPEATTEQ